MQIVYDEISVFATPAMSPAQYQAFRSEEHLALGQEQPLNYRATFQRLPHMRGPMGHFYGRLTRCASGPDGEVLHQFANLNMVTQADDITTKTHMDTFLMPRAKSRCIIPEMPDGAECELTVWVDPSGAPGERLAMGPRPNEVPIHVTIPAGHGLWASKWLLEKHWHAHTAKVWNQTWVGESTMSRPPPPPLQRIRAVVAARRARPAHSFVFQVDRTVFVGPGFLPGVGNARRMAMTDLRPPNVVALARRECTQREAREIYDALDEDEQAASASRAAVRMHGMGGLRLRLEAGGEEVDKRKLRGLYRELPPEEQEDMQFQQRSAAGAPRSCPARRTGHVPRLPLSPHRQHSIA